MNERIFTNVDIRKLGDEGERIYREKLKPLLEPEHKGKIVAIEIESGDYFLGDSVVEAGQRAREKCPDKLFHFMRVGFRALHKRR
ncbi:MAG: hypothetical protein ACE5K2_07675 [Candidatus Zixiibacteriota bacterium]